MAHDTLHRTSSVRPVHGLANSRSLGLLLDDSAIPFREVPTGECIDNRVHKVQRVANKSQHIIQVAARKETPVIDRHDLLCLGSDNTLETRRRRQITREAKLLRRAAHCHIVEVITTYFGPRRHDGTLSFFIVMPYVEKSLIQYTRCFPGVERAIRIQWFGCLINALAHIHGLGIWHRDIKPENIMVKNDNHIVLIDFDISRSLQIHQPGTRTRRISTALGPVNSPRQARWGTIPYLAPEVEYEGPTNAGLPTDIFSLGLVFFEMIVSMVGTKEQEELLFSYNGSYAKHLPGVDKILESIDRHVPVSLGRGTEEALRDMRRDLQYLHVVRVCREMLAKEPYKRPTAEDLRLWWQHQVRKLRDGVAQGCTCDCTCNTVIDYEVGYQRDPDSELNSKLRRAYECGNRLVAKELKQMNAAMGEGNILVAAAQGGLWDIVLEIAKELSGVSRRDSWGETALHYLAAETDLDPKMWNRTVDKLLEKGADILAKDHSGRTPLRIAAETGNADMICRLLRIRVPEKQGKKARERGGLQVLSHLTTSRPSAPKTAGDMLVERLCNGGPVIGDDNNIKIYRAEIISGLLTKSSGREEDTTTLEQKAMAYYDIHPNLDVCELFNAKNDTRGLLEKKDINGQTLLSIAAMHGHEAIVRLLLRQGANINNQDNHGGTPLSMAANFGYVGIVRLLLERHAMEPSDDTTSSSSTKLQRAIDCTDKNNQTPLFKACDQGHVAVVRLLLDHDADTSVTDTITGDTALVRASRRGYWAITQLLLDSEADNPTTTATELESALKSADEGGYWYTARVLRTHAEKNAYPDALPQKLEDRDRKWRQWMRDWLATCRTRTPFRVTGFPRRRVAIAEPHRRFTWFMVMSLFIIVKEIFPSSVSPTQFVSLPVDRLAVWKVVAGVNYTGVFR